MRTYNAPSETTLQSSYRGSASDVVLGGGALVGLLLLLAWPSLKALLAS